MELDIAGLETAGRDELLEHWRCLIGRPPPKHISRGTKMVWADYKSEPNHALIRAIVQARSWVEKLKAGKSVTDITASEGRSEGRLSKRIRLAFLSPKLVTAILDGTTGQELTIKKLSARDIPLNWEEQHARFLC